MALVCRTLCSHTTGQRCTPSCSRIVLRRPLLSSPAVTVGQPPQVKLRGERTREAELDIRYLLQTLAAVG